MMEALLLHSIIDKLLLDNNNTFRKISNNKKLSKGRHQFPWKIIADLNKFKKNYTFGKLICVYLVMNIYPKIKNK